MAMYISGNSWFTFSNYVKQNIITSERLEQYFEANNPDYQQLNIVERVQNPSFCGVAKNFSEHFVE